MYLKTVALNMLDNLSTFAVKDYHKIHKKVQRILKRTNFRALSNSEA